MLALLYLLIPEEEYHPPHFIYKSKTNAPTIYHQKGTSAQIGGSIDIGASLGLEYVVFPMMFIKGQLFLLVLAFHAFRQKYMER